MIEGTTEQRHALVDAQEGTGAAGSLILPSNAKRSADSPDGSKAKSENRAQEEGEGPDFEKSGDGCPNRAGLIFINVDTGDVVPGRCGRNRCSYCVQGNARRRAKAIAFVKPTRSVLLTHVGEDWQTVRARVSRLVYDLRKELGSFEMVWHVEPNPSGDGQHHVHAWQRGKRFIPYEMLRDLADYRGMGRVVSVNAIKNASRASQYGLKGLGYGMKGVFADSARSEYLKANGGRLTHQTGGFFNIEGEKAGVRDVERAAGGADEDARWIAAWEWAQ